MYAACDLRLFLAIYDVGRAHGTAKGHENRGERERERGARREIGRRATVSEKRRETLFCTMHLIFLQSRAVVSQSEDRIWEAFCSRHVSCLL